MRIFIIWMYLILMPLSAVFCVYVYLNPPKEEVHWLILVVGALAMWVFVSVLLQYRGIIRKKRLERQGYNTHKYFLFDARYYSDPDKATCLCVADDLQEAEEDRLMMFPNAVIVRYWINSDGVMENAFIIH